MALDDEDLFFEDDPELDLEDGHESLEVGPGKRIFFIWGPPLAGQMRWMCLESKHMDSRISTYLLPLELQNPQSSLVEVIERLGRAVEALSNTSSGCHVYCELPWDIVYEDIVLDEWIRSRPDLFEGEEAWDLLFVGLIPSDAEKLAPMYRKAIEEFSRASNSTIIIARSEAEDSEAKWVNTDKLDFGQNLEVVEEILWPNPIDSFEGVPPTLADEPLLAVSVPVESDIENLKALFLGFQENKYGSIWGAEAMWKNPKGGLRFFTFILGHVFSWEISHPSIEVLCPPNGALLNVVGNPIKEDQIALQVKSYLYS